jgi:hypothetical protein
MDLRDRDVFLAALTGSMANPNLTVPKAMRAAFDALDEFKLQTAMRQDERGVPITPAFTAGPECINGFTLHDWSPDRSRCERCGGAPSHKKAVRLRVSDRYEQRLRQKLRIAR